MDIQPCFNSEILTELTDVATNTLNELEKIDSSNADVAEVTFGKTDPFQSEDEISFFKAFDADQKEQKVAILQKCISNDPQFPNRVIWKICSDLNVPLEKINFILDPASKINLDFNYADDISDRTCLHEAASCGNLAM